jgi:predicted glycosyltransferase
MSGEGARLLIYSQDGLGLGHLRRTSAVAGAVSAAVPGTAVLLVADSPAAGFFGAVRDLDHLKLPSILKVGPGDWRPVSLPVGFGDVQALRRDLLRTAVLGFRPDLLLVDHMPHGAMGELVPALQSLRDTGARTRVVLGLRDILDAPEVVRRRWLAEGAMEAVERYYDRVLVYGRRDVFDLAEQYGFPPAVTDRLHYTGYLCAASQARLSRPGRNKDGRAQIVAMVGGGADGYELLRTVLDALPAVDAVRPCAATLLTGPFMPKASRQDLERRAKSLPARVRESVRDLPPLVAAADVAVAMAGYNSSVEVLVAGTPAVLVPRAGPSAEQRTRARLFAERGWVRTIEPEHLDEATLAAAMLDRLTGPKAAPASPPDIGGLPVIVEHLRSLLAAPATIPAVTRRP